MTDDYTRPTDGVPAGLTASAALSVSLLTSNAAKATGVQSGAGAGMLNSSGATRPYVLSRSSSSGASYGTFWW